MPTPEEVEAVEGAGLPAEAGNAPETRLGALAGLLAKMDADELKRATAMVEDERKRRGLSKSPNRISEDGLEVSH